MKKNILQKFLLIFIILLPILDILSFEFRKILGTSWSPSTFLRPIIPIVVFVILFFKEKIKIKSLTIAAIYGLYSLIHLLIYQKLATGISFGGATYELQYLVNYTFNILTLFVFLFVFYNQDTNKLKKYVIISSSIYIFSIYLSIITNTYTPTYVEGIGIKGWFESGNSLSTTLILNLFILLAMFNNNNKKIYLIVIVCLIEIFLLLLLGTRTALLGGLLVAILYIIFTIFYQLKNKVKINKKLVVCITFLLSSAIVIVAIIMSSKTIERRKYLASLDAAKDIHTGEILHVTSDISDIYYNMNNNLLPDEFMSESEEKALDSLYSFANKHEISCTNRRIQELMYNIYLVKYQKNILSIIFGNGLLNNYAELVLEIELPAFILNFGIIGFVLYFVPFLIAFIYALYNGLKYRKNLDSEYLLLLCGLLFAFCSTCFTGVTFFNTSSATFVTLIIVLLINKIKKYKSNII